MTADFHKSYFALFGIPQSYIVNEILLAQQYRERQAAVHPDRYSNGTAQEKRLSMQQASLTNEAYETLKSPLKRALYLLLILGFDVDAEKAQLGPDFLFEQMDLRENLAGAVTQEDPYAVMDDVTGIVRQRQKALIEEIQAAFERVSAAQFPAIYVLTQKLQFFDKLLEEVRHTEAKLEDSY